MSKVIDIRSVKSKNAPIIDETSLSFITNKQLFPREVTIHGISYDISITSDYTYCIDDHTTGKTHVLKSLISKYDTDDVSKLLNSTMWINGTGSLTNPSYINSSSITVDFNKATELMEEDIMEAMEDMTCIAGEDLFSSNLYKSLRYEANLLYGPMAYLRFSVEMFMDFNRIENKDSSPCYSIYLSNATQKPNVNSTGYLYLLTDYPFKFMTEGDYDPVVDSKSGLTGIKVFFNLAPRSFEDINIIDYENRL